MVTPRNQCSISIGMLLVVLVSWLSSPGHAQPVSFHREVMPLLTRAGCNAGACHGAALGRGGLHLSLFGSDAKQDYYALVHQLEGRRVHQSSPEKSLMLRKPLGQLNHGGDQLFDEESLEYQTLTRWIAQGAVLDSAVELNQFQVNAEQLEDRQEHVYRLSATASSLPVSSRAVNQQPSDATSKNATTRDVTRFTHFTVADTDAVELDLARGQVRLLRPGRHVIIARYLDRVQSITLSRAYPTQFLNSHPANNFIDREIHSLLDELNLPVGRSVSDTEFLRRVSLDLTGRLPTLEETTSYIASQEPDKRQRAIDRLLASPAFNDYWTLVYARWLRLHSLPGEPQAAIAFGDWIRRSIADGESWRSMTRQLLTAQGDSHVVGPANFSRMVGDARGHAELVSEVFLGARMGCANCHDHPLDRWTQDDYHGLAAMLARLDRGRQVRFTSRGDVTNPKTSSPARWRLPGDRYVSESLTPMETLADWLTKPEQAKLSHSFVNRVWSEMFGRGLVEPVDDLRDTNPSTHPALFNQLSARVQSRDFDLRSLLRWIASSEAYARESVDQANEFYGFQHSRHMSPHILADAISDVTGLPIDFANLPYGARAVHVLDPLSPSPALDLLGRCQRAAACPPTGNATGLATQLHLINGELINRALVDPGGRLARMAKHRSTAEVIEEFTLRAMARKPDAVELNDWLVKLDSLDEQERLERLQDWLWSLLCSQRFQCK